MEIYNPFFQLEVRYLPILNFSSVSRNLIAPYMQLTNRFGIENENTFKESFQLISEPDNYMIVVGFDRIFIRSQGNINNMIKENSIVENIFFSLLNKIKKVENFGKIENYLLLVSTVYIDNKEDNAVRFVNNFVSKRASSLLDSYYDGAVELIKKEGDQEVTLICGPHLGEEDINKRRTRPPFRILDFDIDRLGQISEIKIFEKKNFIDFSSFKRLVKEYSEYDEKIQNII